MPTLYSWYSEAHAERSGTILVYGTMHDQVVRATYVARSLEGGNSYLWKDKKYVGEVTTYLKSEVSPKFLEQYEHL